MAHQHVPVKIHHITVYDVKLCLLCTFQSYLTTQPLLERYMYIDGNGLRNMFHNRCANLFTHTSRTIRWRKYGMSACAKLKGVLWLCIQHRIHRMFHFLFPGKMLQDKLCQKEIGRALCTPRCPNTHRYGGAAVVIHTKTRKQFDD